MREQQGETPDQRLVAPSRCEPRDAADHRPGPETELLPDALASPDAVVSRDVGDTVHTDHPSRPAALAAAGGDLGARRDERAALPIEPSCGAAHTHGTLVVEGPDDCCPSPAEQAQPMVVRVMT